MKRGLLLALLVVGCSNTATIAGYPVGDKMCDGAAAVAPSFDDDIACEALSSAAIDMLKGGHAAVVSNETYRDRYGISRTYGTGHAQGVVVLKLSDQTTHAFFLGCVMGPYGGDPPKGGPCAPMEPMGGETWKPPS